MSSLIITGKGDIRMSCGSSPSFLFLLYLFCPHSLLSNREAQLFKHSRGLSIVPLSEKATWGERHTWTCEKGRERRGEEGRREKRLPSLFPPQASHLPEPTGSVSPLYSGTSIAVTASNTGVCYHVRHLLLFSEHSSRHVIATQSLLLHD